ncbi:MAG TPA: biopolymer transporter ExbD, partial [Vampirovibrionales bacterium]
MKRGEFLPLAIHPFEFLGGDRRMKINGYDSQTEEARIELIPLIDVIFCILTFFLLAALQLTRQQAVNVDLPQAETGTVQMQELKLFVSVDQLGQTYVDKQPVTREQLYQLLLTYKRARPEGLIVLSASKMASYNDVIQVLDLLRSVGGDRRMKINGY